MLYWQELSEYIFFYGLDIANYFIYGKYPRILKGYSNYIFRDNIEKFLDKNIKFSTNKIIKYNEFIKITYKLLIQNKYHVKMIIIYSKNINNINNTNITGVLLDHDLFGYHKQQQFNILRLNNIKNKKYIIICDITTQNQIDRLISLRKLGWTNKLSNIELFNSNNTDCCPICLDKMKNGIKLSCGHSFHHKCFIKLFLHDKLNKFINCPLCRTKFNKLNLY